MTELTDEIRGNIKSMLTAQPKPKEVRRQIIASDGKEHRSSTGNVNWPYASDALGVAPEQIAEAQETLRAAGIPTTDFTDDGRPVLRSQTHLRQVAKAMGKFCGAHGYVAKDENNRPVNTGRSPAQERRHVHEQAQEFLATGQCSDPCVERMIHETAMNMGNESHDF